MSAAVLLALASLMAWLVLSIGRGMFWQVRLPDAAPEPALWPSVAAVVPARDEADLIERSIGSLLRQDYPGPFSIILVDDHSSDGTVEIARRLRDSRLHVVSVPPLPRGWTGKLWAMRHGVEHIDAADLVLFTDADIAHHRSNLRELVARLEAEKRDLVSLMVRLHCDSPAERLLIPAFVFFFAMLYPFVWVGDLRRPTAAAAGGCMLIRRHALTRIGGFDGFRDALIDDVALARAIKRSGGSIRLDLTRETVSLRRYPAMADIWNMVARTAFTQLGYSPLLLGGTAVAMTITFFLPPTLFLFGSQEAAWLAGAAWLLMSSVYFPMIRFYGLSPAWTLLLPIATLVYLGATVSSAWRHFRGHGGSWKGRVEWRNAR